jgi:hypothetical protein
MVTSHCVKPSNAVQIATEWVRERIEKLPVMRADRRVLRLNVEVCQSHAAATDLKILDDTLISYIVVDECHRAKAAGKNLRTLRLRVELWRTRAAIAGDRGAVNARELA